MIFHKHKAIYFHIPRTCGTSIIKKFVSLGEILDNEHSHKSWKYYKDNYSEEVYSHYFKFAVIRNPFEKVVSSFCHKHKDYDNFDDWIKWIDEMWDITKFHVLGTAFYWIGRKIETNDLIRYETFEKDWNRICEKIGIDNKLEHLNKSKIDKKHYRDYYTDYSKKIVEKYYFRDLSQFEYTF